jgi:hypothetical protein
MRGLAVEGESPQMFLTVARKPVLVMPEAASVAERPRSKKGRTPAVVIILAARNKATGAGHRKTGAPK